MKKDISFILILSGTLLLSSSCSKFLEVNETPNNPVNVPPATILPVTTIGTAFTNANELGRMSSILVQHTAGLANVPAATDVYNLDNQLDNQWTSELYGGTLNNLQKIIDLHEATSPAYAGIAKLQMAYVFSIATDLFGDVPYSQAAQGLEFSSPRFDKQEDIYQGNASAGITSLFDLVKSGLADLDKTGTFKPGTDDLVYKGNLANWKRMGNTLLLKFAMQISNVNPTLTKSTIASVIAGNNYINANNLDFEVPFGNTPGNQNPHYSFNNLNRTNDQMASARFIALSRSLNDTVRLAKLITKPNGIFTGFDNGSTAVAPILATRSRPNIYITGTTGEAPVRMLTNFQTAFILAESAVLFNTAGNADSLYKAGIRAHMQKTGMTTADIDNYFSTNPNIVNLSGNVEEQRRQIITQKYIAWFGNGIEAYNDFRRTGYPPLMLSQNAAGDDANTLPKRLPYTPQELTRNPNAPTPRPLTNVKVWWAK